MKIYILIPIKNQSARLDGKNMMLLPFTLAWIEREISALPARIRDAVRVATFGNIPRAMQKSIERYGVAHVKLPYH